jgi:hypothetical protein
MAPPIVHEALGFLRGRVSQESSAQILDDSVGDDTQGGRRRLAAEDVETAIDAKRDSVETSEEIVCKAW